MKERWLFAALVLLLLVPVWSVGYFPSTDGPSHVYNAWILRQHGNAEEYPLFQEHYEIDWRPIPNWLSHALLALLLFPFEPRAAEKVLLTGYVVLFAAAARYLAGSVDPDRRWLGYLALPLVYNQLLQRGFYNFSFSLAFYLLALGYWWRHREEPTPGFALKLNLLLLLCWFAHIVSLVLALASIGVLWLATLRGRPFRRHLLHPLMLAPQVLLPLWFLQAQGSERIAATWSAETLWTYFLRLGVLYAFGKEQTWIGTALAALFGALLLATLAVKIRRREIGEADGFLLLSLLALALYFFSPEGMSGGTLLKNRLSLYPYLLLIPWLAPRFPKPGRIAVVGALALLTAFQVGLLVRWYRIVERDVLAFLEATGPIAPDSRVLPLLFDRNPPTLPALGMLSHAIDWAAIDKGLVEWDNYEAASRLFPIRFRDDVGMADIYTIEAHPGNVNLQHYKGRADYVFTWKLPPGSPMARRLRRHYKPVSPVAPIAESAPGRVYVRKGAGRARRAGADGP